MRASANGGGNGILTGRFPTDFHISADIGRDGLSDLKLSLAMGDYDRTRPLVDGRVSIDGVDPECMLLTPEEIRLNIHYDVSKRGIRYGHVIEAMQFPDVSIQGPAHDQPHDQFDSFRPGFLHVFEVWHVRKAVRVRQQAIKKISVEFGVDQAPGKFNKLDFWQSSIYLT